MPNMLKKLNFLVVSHSVRNYINRVNYTIYIFLNLTVEKVEKFASLDKFVHL